MKLGKPNDVSPLKGKGKSRQIAHIDYIEFDASGENISQAIEQYGLRSRTNRTSEPSALEKAEAIGQMAKAMLMRRPKRARKSNAIRNSLHPRASAAAFLGLTKSIFGSFIKRTGGEGRDKRFADFRREIFELCDAWHWLHMEVYGEHLKAMDTKTVRLSGAVVNSSRAKIVRAIVMDEVKTVDAREPRKLVAASITRKIKGLVHQRCAEQGIAVKHRPKGRSLDELVREARKNLRTP